MANQISGSPWDEPLDEIKETKKPQPSVVGDLDFAPDDKREQKGTTPKTQPLKVPSDVEEKVGGKIPAEKVMPPPGQPVKVAIPAGESKPPPAPVKDSAEKGDFWSEVYQSASPARTTADSILAKPSESISLAKPQTIPQTPAAQPAAPVPAPAAKQIDITPAKTQPAQTSPPVAPNVAPISAPGIQSKPTSQPISPSPMPTPPSGATAPAGGAPAVPKKSKAKGVILALIFGIILLFAGGVFLTEEGIISLGLEKVYGAVHLEGLWKGLPENPENAFVIATAKIKGQESYKITGNLTMTVNRGVKSDIITPIVSATALPIISLKDEEVGNKIRAILAVSQLELAETAPTTSSATSTTASVEEVTGSISAKVDPNISGAKIDLKTKKDPFSRVEMIYSNKKLYLKTSETIVFDEKAKGSWSAIDLSKINIENPPEKFWSSTFSGSNFSITGSRVGNEKIEEVRCYHYSGKVNLGDALSAFGLKGSSAQEIEFDFWLGVKDHLLYKMELKIIPNTAAAVSRINLSLQFSDFGSDVGSFSVPASSIPYSGVSTGTSQPTPSQAVSSITSRDSQRKSDLASIAKALEQYFATYKKYPVATKTEKISQTSGVLFSALVPSYITALPLDPLDPTYYYGYESDGSHYTLSAVLEDKSDKEGKTVGSKYLYFLKSQ